jgi:hypothetical protein
LDARSLFCRRRGIEFLTVITDFQKPAIVTNRGFFIWKAGERKNMNTNYKALKRVPTEFEEETQFELRPALSAAQRAAQQTEFERLKSRLLARELAEAATPELGPPLQRAAIEAAALAWETLVPLLVFPTLFEEKAAAAMRQSNRQARIWAGSDLVVV